MERALWQRLRAGALGAKFRRQHPLGPYTLDFAAVETRLAVELDGDTHAIEDRQQRERNRTAYLLDLGWRVLGFTNREVAANLEGVLQAIQIALRQHPHPNPLPEGEGAETT